MKLFAAVLEAELEGSLNVCLYECRHGLPQKVFKCHLFVRTVN